MKAERLVMDTNVVINAALLSNSVPAVCLRLALQRHRMVFSPATFEELQTRLWRPKFDRYISLEDRRLFLADLAAVADWLDPEPLMSPTSRDANDDKFLALARASAARWLISGDDDLLVLGKWGEVEIITPAAAVARWVAARSP